MRGDCSIKVAMKLNKTILWAAGGFLTVAFAGIFTAPKVAAAIPATFVEVVVPSNPFYGRMNLSPQNFVKSVGPETGTLGVTNITVTNFDSTRNTVFILAPLFAGGGCGSVITGGAGPNLTISVEPFATQTVAYPTPLVFGGIQGHTCVAAQGSGNVEVYVNGFVN
jgi:hypothetical protein